MNVPTVSVFTPTPISSFNAESIASGIEKRLALLTSLFCPEEELPPELVLEQLRIEETNPLELKVRWKPRMRYPVRAYKFGDELAEQKQTAAFGLSWYAAAEVVEPQRIIDSAVDGVGFFHGYDRDDMGWPVVIAAAASLVDEAGGAIVTNGYGWFVPTDNEVKWILEP